MASIIAPPSFASFRHKRGAERGGRLLTLVASLTNGANRAAAARALAAHAGAENLLIFLRDADLGILLPAPGFPQTLPQARQWQDFLDRCRREFFHEGGLPYPERVGLTKATGVAADDGSVVVLLGGHPQMDMAIDIGLLLPIVAAALQGERAALVAEAQAELARQTATQAKLLAASLDRARDELRHALAEANRANAAKDRFLAVLSHELRTPLNPVLMAASAMEIDPDLPPEMRADIAMIRRNVELEANLIDDLLDLTRIANGKVQLQRKMIDTHELLREAIAVVQADPASICQQIDVDLRASAHHIKADSARIQQVFWNLIRNAVKFTPPDGCVTVRTDNPESQTLRIQVSDTGIGIAPDALPKIFNAFEQGDANISRMFGGLGLGLAISNALAKLHDGELRAESAGLQKGAIFTLELPAIAQTAALPESSAEAKKRGPCRRILLVEDHATTAAVMARLLEKRGHTVILAHTQADAIAVGGEQQFDIVLSDLGLPDGNGYEVMQALKAKPGLIGIAVSGYGMQADVARSAQAGFHHHLTKPIDAQQLYELIDQVVAEQLA